MMEIEERMHDLVNETIYHRFREGTDLQYAFLYFHYLYHTEMLHKNDHLREVFSLIDADADGQLNDRELDSLNHIVYGIQASYQTKRTLLQCLKGNLTEHQREYRDNRGNLKQHIYTMANITFEDVMGCEKAAKELEIAFPFEQKMQKGSDEFVAFQMIKDDYFETQRQLDSVRKRKSKFVCINDDIQVKTTTHERIIRDFYESFFPIPSQFENDRST